MNWTGQGSYALADLPLNNNFVEIIRIGLDSAEKRNILKYPKTAHMIVSLWSNSTRTQTLASSFTKEVLTISLSENINFQFSQNFGESIQSPLCLWTLINPFGSLKEIRSLIWPHSSGHKLFQLRFHFSSSPSVLGYPVSFNYFVCFPSLYQTNFAACENSFVKHFAVTATAAPMPKHIHVHIFN